MNILKKVSKHTLLATALVASFNIATATNTAEHASSTQTSVSQSNSTGASSNMNSDSRQGNGQANQATGSRQAGSEGSSAGAGAASEQSGNANQANTAGKSESGKKQAQSGSAKGQPPVYLLVPIEVASNENSMKKGCWAKIYDRENFVGDSLTLVGPAALANLSGPFGLDWDDRVNSIQVGPKATVTVFDNEGFTEQVAQFKPGQKVADISKRLGFFDEFASVTIACQK